MHKSSNFYAVILSGGSGERFWPLSTPERPKQFLTVFGGKSLLRQAVDRLKGLVPPERVLVVTGKALVKATRAELPELPRANIVAEPCRRDTAAAVATACGVVEGRGGANLQDRRAGDGAPARAGRGGVHPLRIRLPSLHGRQPVPFHDHGNGEEIG